MERDENLERLGSLLRQYLLSVINLSSEVLVNFNTAFGKDLCLPRSHQSLEVIVGFYRRAGEPALYHQTIVLLSPKHIQPFSS